MNTQISDEQKWQMLVDRQPQDDFLYAVVTTGVVCRTGCPSRPPHRDNVRFYTTLASAIEAGYRPCKRCLGGHDRHAVVASMCRQLESDTGVAALARRHGISERQVQRLFKEVLGVSPKQYQIEARVRTFLARVRAGERVIDASYAAGFPSPSRLYEQLRDRTGLSPKGHRHTHLGMPVFYAIENTSIGTLLLAQTPKGLCFAGFYDDAASADAALRTEFPEAETIAVAPSQMEPIRSAFEAAVSGEFDALRKLPLDIRGTAFQCAVWKAARAVPPGQRVSYAEVAARIDKPNAVRAVANALGRNRIALAIPCHRVVPSAGDETGGYRWGRARKAALLAQESAG